jgi:hypothetical protein
MNAHVEAPDMPAANITHADGIYFGMSDTEYHSDPALGSSSLKKLVDNAPDFWWTSWMNPAREEDSDDTPSKIFGRQLHQCVLEGADVFKAGHAPQYHPGNRKEGIAEIADIRASGKVPVKFRDWQRILAASAFIKANKNLANAFTGGQPEVSVFWTQDDIRFKARFDYLKTRAITDLKSIRSKNEKPFQMQCMDAMASYDYPVSAEHYSEGRRQMIKLLQQDAVFGAEEAGVRRPWLIELAGMQFAFVFVFWKAEGSPITSGFTLSPQNPLLEIGRRRIDRAVNNYRLFMEEFGTDTAWVLNDPLKEIDESDLPPYYHYRESARRP